MQTISTILKEKAAQFGLMVHPYAPLPPNCFSGLCARQDACRLLRDMEQGVSDYILTEKRGLRGAIQHWFTQLSRQAQKEGCSRVEFPTNLRDLHKN